MRLDQAPPSSTRGSVGAAWPPPPAPRAERRTRRFGRLQTEVPPVDAGAHPIDHRSTLLERDRERGARRVPADAGELHELLQRIRHAPALEHRCSERLQCRRSPHQPERPDHRRDRIHARPGKVVGRGPPREESLVHRRDGLAARALQEDLRDQDPERVVRLAPRERPSMFLAPTEQPRPERTYPFHQSGGYAPRKASSRDQRDTLSIAFRRGQVEHADQHPKGIALLRYLGRASCVSSRSPRQGLGAESASSAASRAASAIVSRWATAPACAAWNLSTGNSSFLLMPPLNDVRPRICRVYSRVCDDAHR